MGFTEKTHAFISASFYKHLVEMFGERGKKAFIHGTIYYAEQRGRRMAQRAIKDGRELNFATYMQYGEWVFSEELKSKNECGVSEIAEYEPDFVEKVYSCPWHRQFVDMGLSEAGEIYCKYLDTAICRGFNPEIPYVVSQTLYKHDCCIQSVKDAGLKNDASYPKKMEYVKDFSYHTAHAYFSFKEVAEGIFGEEGSKTALLVLNDFKVAYGEEMTEKLLSYKDTNFNKA